MIVAAAALTPRRAPGGDHQRRTLAQAGHHLREHLVAGDSLQLNVEIGGVADRRRTVIGLVRLLLLANNGLERGKMRRLAVGQHVRQVGDLQQRAGAEDVPRLFHRRAGDVCTTLGRQGDHLHSSESLKHLADARAAHAKGLCQRLFRQFAPRQQLVFDNRGHQRLEDGFVFVMQV